MDVKPTARIAAMTARRIAGAGGAAIALFLMAACSTRQDASAAQQKAADKLGIPVEKILPKSGIVLRLIPAGTFTMGSPKGETGRRDDEAQHKVTLTKAFYIGKHEVTQGQWKKVMGDNPSRFKDAGDNAPVEYVNWHECTNFVKKLAVLEGMPQGSFRLPTEAEWEYACRAGTQTTFCYGDTLDTSRASFSRQKTMPVGQFKPNAWGLYDMHGNVWEWCADWYGSYTGDETDPTGPALGANRVLRGGGWDFNAFYCRSAQRTDGFPPTRWNIHGLRICMPTGQ